MFFTRRLLSYAKWNGAATDWLQTTWGRRFRIGLLGGTIVCFPIGSLIVDGPMINVTFPWRHKVRDLPEDIQSLAKEEYNRFLEREARVPKDAVATAHLSEDLREHDSVAAGSIGMRTGLHTALPFYAQFHTTEEALQYMRERSGPFVDFLGERLSIDWDTPTGRELASTFVLSDSARRFLLLRDMYAHDGWAAIGQRSTSYATWTTFSSIFTYWLHGAAKICGGTGVSFITTYAICFAGAWFAHQHWHMLYRFMTDVHADSEAAKATFEHSEGGKQFYWQQLKRHRILRDLHPHLYTKVKASGDVRGVPTPIIVRFDHLKSRMSVPVGLAACALSSLLFGSCFVPIKKYDAGNGLFVQWVMAAAIFCVGLVVFSIEGFPQFQPLAMLGGMFWALGNATAVPIMNVLGLGLGMLIWGVTNCVAGWACGRFGLFGINATVPSMPLLNYLGLILVIAGGFLFSQVRASPRLPSISIDSRSNSPVRSEEEEEGEPLLQGTTAVDGGHRQKRRICATATALLAGLFYGVTFVPVIYMQDHPELYPNASRDGLPYVFSHFTGIFVTSTAILIVYILLTQNQIFVNARIVGPGLVAGTMWAVAQSSWFVANDNVSQSVSFPIISMVPGACAAVWSVLYFKEIEGNRNLRLLAVAIFTTMLGATFVGISK